MARSSRIKGFLSRLIERLRSASPAAAGAEPDALQRLTDKFEADLAQRREIERELAHLASFAEMDPNFILETDLEGNVLYMNIAAQEQVPDLSTRGKAHPLLEGMQVVGQVLQSENKPHLSRSIKVGETIYKQQITLIERGSRLRIYMTDITELKHLDQLKTDFVNIVSHELRTPLTGLQASIRMLESGMLGPLTKEQAHSLGIAVSSIQRLGRLINNLLDVSQIEAGGLKLNRQHVELGPLLEDLQHTFQPLARERSLELRIRPPAAPLSTFLDRDKLQQIFTNLLHNAMKFTSKGWVELSASVQGNEILCVVADSGPGILPADLPKLFGKFQQVGVDIPRVEKGSGLGLSITKGLVELHKGKIWVESTVGQGTRFIFTLPMFSAAETFREQVTRRFEHAVASSHPLCLLAFQMMNWDVVQRTVGETCARLIMDRLEALVKGATRDDADALIRTPSQILLIVQGVDKTAGQVIVDRIKATVQEPDFQKNAGTPVSLECRIAAFPDDGKLIEQLLALIQISPSPSK